MIEVRTINFEVRGLPQPKGSMQAFAFVNKVTGKARAVVTAGNNAKGTKAWADSVRESAKAHAPAIVWDGPVKVTLGFIMQAPQSLPKTRPSFATKKPDADKLERNVLDALTGVIFRDDAQVVECNKTKQYGDAPGVLVTIDQVPLDSPLGWTPRKDKKP